MEIDWFSILVGCVSAALVCIGAELYKKLTTKTPLEMEAVVKMNMKRRKLYVRARIAQAICDSLEELYFKEKITRWERDYWYQKIGSRCDLLDLLPRGPKLDYPHPEDLKQELLNRRGNKILDEFRKKWDKA
jgi:hypothetical protein